MFPIVAFNTVVRSFAENHLKLSSSKSQMFCKFKPIVTMLKTFDLLGNACTCISFCILGMVLILYGLVNFKEIVPWNKLMQFQRLVYKTMTLNFEIKPV